MSNPIPYDEGDVEEVFWKPEEEDKVLPSPGFITDFVLATRGIEAPTIFSMWTAISILSSAIKREGYLKWFPRSLLPNFYVILVGPPRIVAKSTVISYGEGILDSFWEVIPSEKLSVLKRPNILRSRATPEALAQALQPSEEHVIEGSTVTTVKRYSQLSIIISELSTFLGKQKYNIGMVERLTNYYDCRPADDDLTVTKGLLRTENLYITLLAGTTEAALEASIPDTAFGDGFMSRVILVYKNTPTRIYSEPREVMGAPDMEELRKRLGWVTWNGMGEFVLEPAAKREYNKWYREFKHTLNENKEGKFFKMMTRFDIHLLKLALLIRANRYEEGRVITLQDYREAKRILEATYSQNHGSIENVGVSDLTKHYNRIKKELMLHPVKRRDLLRKMSPYGCYKAEVNHIITNYVEEGRVEILLDGKPRRGVSKNGEEVYVWRQTK